MIEIKGKYTTAKVMIDEIDQTTTAQIVQMVNHPAFTNPIAIMPDTHAGKGSVIGFTMKASDKIIPNIIGVDIGCGVLTSRIKLEGSLEDIDKAIRKVVPLNTNVHQVFTSGCFPKGFVRRVKDVCAKVGMCSDRAFASLGTLGGGNHYIELGLGNEAYTLSVHSGSRQFGKMIAEYHQKIAKETCTEKVPKGMEYLVGDAAEEYLEDMSLAQCYAAWNRAVISDNICCTRAISGTNALAGFSPFDTVHNYIDGEGIIRKGAISAHAGEKVAIPLNMRDGVIIGIGRGNEEWNESAPHGAGRVLSRSQAKAQLSLEDATAQMQGVYTSNIPLDEAPAAYKDAGVIRDLIDGVTIDVIDVVKPVLNIKG